MIYILYNMYIRITCLYTRYACIYIYYIYIYTLLEVSSSWIIPSNGCLFPDSPSQRPCPATGDSASLAPPKLLDRLVPCLMEGRHWRWHMAHLWGTPESRDMARNNSVRNKSTKPKRNLSTLHTSSILLL